MEFIYTITWSKVKDVNTLRCFSLLRSFQFFCPPFSPLSHFNWSIFHHHDFNDCDSLHANRSAQWFISNCFILDSNFPDCNQKMIYYGCTLQTNRDWQITHHRTAVWSPVCHSASAQPAGKNLLFILLTDNQVALHLKDLYMYIPCGPWWVYTNIWSLVDIYLGTISRLYPLKANRKGVMGALIHSLLESRQTQHFGPPA